MGGTHCAVPGCYNSVCSAKRHGTQRRSLFSILRPEFAKTPEEREHRIALREFMLSVRESDKDCIKKMLHKETASICEDHFLPTDLVDKGKTLKTLRIGAMPCLNLPKQVAPDKKFPTKRTCVKNAKKLTAHEMGLTCRVPGCGMEVFEETKRTNMWYKYTAFHSKNPKFMKEDDPKREWHKRLMEFMLTLPTKNDLAESYHRDCVTICERHFADTDLVYVQGTKKEIIKKLREGAMPTLHLPDGTGSTSAAKENRNDAPRGCKPLSIKMGPRVNSHRTFASLAARAKKCIRKDWSVTVEEDLVRCLKQSPGKHDQNEVTVEITNDFKIGIVFFGWCLPKFHFATEFDICKNSLGSFLAYLESMQPCEGFQVPSRIEILEKDDVVKHTVTKSSSAFSHEPITTTLLTNRSRDCDVLLQKPSFGSCKACSAVKSQLKKRYEKEEKSSESMYSVTPGISENDSFQVVRLKKHLQRKMEELKMAMSRYGTMKMKANSYEGLTAQLREQLKCKTITFEEYMKPILKYIEVNNTPPIFEAFWTFQMMHIWMNTDQKLMPTAIRYPESLLRLYSDIYCAGKTAYYLLMRSGVISMPGRSTIKKFSAKLSADREQCVDAVITKVGTDPEMADQEDDKAPADIQPAVNDSPASESCEELPYLYGMEDTIGLKRVSCMTRRLKRKTFVLYDDRQKELEEGYAIPAKVSKGAEFVPMCATEPFSNIVTIEVEVPPLTDSEWCEVEGGNHTEGKTLNCETFESNEETGKQSIRIDELEWIAQTESMGVQPAT